MFGTPPAAVDFSGRTPAHWAALMDELETARAIATTDPGAFAKVDEEGRRPLHFARSEAMARFLAHVDPHGLEARDAHGNLPLHYWAAQHGPASVALNKFCKQWRPFWVENAVNAVNDDGETAMSFAIRANDLDTVEQLLECRTYNVRRANPKTHLTVLHEAAALGRTEIIEKILNSARGIDVIFVDMFDPNDLTANALAIVHQHPETAAVLRHWRAALVKF